MTAILPGPQWDFSNGLLYYLTGFFNKLLRRLELPNVWLGMNAHATDPPDAIGNLPLRASVLTQYATIDEVHALYERMLDAVEAAIALPIPTSTHT